MTIAPQEIIRPAENLIGAFHGLPIEQYFRAPGISKSALDLLRRSPETYREYMDGKYRRESSPALEMGRAVHALTLENRRTYVVRPFEIPDRNGEMESWHSNKLVCKAWLKQQTQTVLSPSEAAEVQSYADAVHADPFAKQLLEDGEAELSIFADIDGQRLKGRPDWAGSDYFMDLKTTSDADTDEFSKEIYNRRYHVQAALYLRIAAALSLPQKRWFFIAVQKSDPPRVNVRELHESAIDLGNCELDDDLQLLRECRASNNWYGFSGNSGKIERIDVPAWAHAKYASKGPQITIGGKSIF